MDYYSGKEYEIYRIKIPLSYADKEFCEIVNDVYQEEGLLLFALEVVVNGKDSGEILLNPGNYKLPKPFSSKIKYRYYGYIIASDSESAEAVF